MLGNKGYRDYVHWIKKIGFLLGRLGLARKLILIYAVVLLIPISVYTVSFLNNARMDTEQNALENSKQVVQYARMNIDRNVEVSTTAAQSAIGNMKFIQFLSERREYSANELIDFKNGLLREVQNIQNLNSGIFKLRIFLDNPYFEDIWPTIYNEDLIKNDPMWMNIKALQGRTYWEMSQVKELVPNADHAGPSTVSLFREVRYPANMHLGTLEIAMQSKTFFGDLDKYRENEYAFFSFLTGKDRKVVFNTNNRFIEANDFNIIKVENELNRQITGTSGHFLVNINKVHMLVVYDYIQEIDSYICYFKSTTGYLKQMESTSATVIVTSLAAFVLLVVITYFLTTVILKQIKIILTTMRKVEGGTMNVELPVAGKDEIGEMAFHMRKMLGRINELVNTLDMVQGELQKGGDTEERIREVNELIYQFRIHELNYILLNDNLSEIEIKNILDTIKIEILKKEARFAVLTAYGNTVDSKMNGAVCENLRQYIERFAKDHEIQVFSFVDTENHLVFITNDEWNFQEFVACIEEETGLEVVVALSDKIGRATMIRKAYVEVNEALKYRVVTGHGKVIEHSAIRLLSSEFSVPIEDVMKIQQMMTMAMDKTVKIEEKVDAVFDLHKIKTQQIGYVEKLVEVFNQYIIRHFAGYTPHKTYRLTRDYSSLADVFNYRSMEDYTHELKSFIQEICRFFQAIRNEEKGIDEIDTAILYINENYHKDLSMGMVANHVSLNYHYFSSLFNERAGMSFVDYLKRIRVGKAKELLRSTDLKIQDVALRVGYDNPKYFARIFREMTGVSPLEFKK